MAPLNLSVLAAWLYLAVLRAYAHFGGPSRASERDQFFQTVFVRHVLAGLRRALFRSVQWCRAARLPELSHLNGSIHGSSQSCAPRT